MVPVLNETQDCLVLMRHTQPVASSSTSEQFRLLAIFQHVIKKQELCFQHRSVALPS